MTTTELHPFVKWAGGKKQLLDKIVERMPPNFSSYYEPFLGGGALFLHTRPPNACINDINEQLINAYTQLKNDVEAVISTIEKYDSVNCDANYYLSVREQYNQKIQNHELDAECAAMMIWINKHCFNGLYRVNSKGLFNVSYNNKTNGSSMNADNLRAIGQYLDNSNVSITQGDFELVCQTAKSGDFVYFDSPYVPISATANFTDYTKEGFSLEDHKRLAALFRELDKKGVMCMSSNHDTPFVHSLYNGFKIETVDVRRNINRDASKRTGTEVIITNY